jgi:hypothetical protein
MGSGRGESKYHKQKVLYTTSRGSRYHKQGVRYTMGRAQNTITREFNVPWVYHWQGVQYTMGKRVLHPIRRLFDIPLAG